MTAESALTDPRHLAVYASWADGSGKDGAHSGTPALEAQRSILCGPIRPVWIHVLSECSIWFFGTTQLGVQLK